MRFFASLLAHLLVAGLVFAPQANAQSPPATKPAGKPAPKDSAGAAVPETVGKGPVYGKWQLICSKPASMDPSQGCRISQSVLAEKAQTRLLLVRVYKAAPPIAMISTPHSIALKPGVVMKIDEQPSRAYSFETCNEDGCHVGIPLEGELEAEWRGGRVAVFHFFDGGQRRVAVPVSLEGFSDAVTAMASRD
ncbi:MAG TPA: invasion associated locus B family protein [Hyphomicrobiaceae bacterium]|nr:invasion associated locus B family protein [Hyphomicrobiaceae bacterium]